MKIKEIFMKQTKFWTEQNVNFFGVVPREWPAMSSEEIQKALEEDKSKYWNIEDPENLCEMASKIYNGEICRDSDKLIHDRLKLKNNIISGCIDVYGDFKDARSLHEDKIIASIPSPAPDLTWIINKIKYTPRITAFRDYTMIRNNGKKIIQHGEWSYDLESGEFEVKSKESAGKHPFDLLTTRSKYMLEAAIGQELTLDNFEDALKLIPVVDRTSIYNYGFSHLEMFFDLIRNGTRFANPLKNIQLAVNTIFMRQNHSFDVSDKLVASQSPIFSLENFRTVVYKSSMNSGAKTAGANANKSYTPSFAFTDSEGLFDAFKTTTNAAAGRHRLLLDNVYTKNDMLYVKGKDGKHYNMFEIMFGRYTNDKNISAISSSLFCNNNDPKRIMMTSKLSAQAVSVDGEADMFTNRVPARVVFGDFKGWSYADSIILSESFAKKLKSREIKNAEVSSKSKLFSLRDSKGIGDQITVNEMEILFPTMSKSIIKGFESVTIKNIEDLSPLRYRLVLELVTPFRTGDKLTNLHGSKGVCGYIMPDDEMPRLINDIGDFKAGPFDVIISGFSVLRRGSLGQIFEAWSTAAGIEFDFGKDFAINAIKEYEQAIKEFSEKSIVEFGGERTIKPCGIIDMIRLYHHATTKVSLSYIRNNSRKMLNLGNMEKMNLAATGKYDILKELAIRSTRKFESSYWHVYNMMKTREIPENLQISSNFARILKSVGLVLEVEGNTLVESDSPEMYKEYEQIISEVSDNNLIDLDDIYGG